MTNVLVSPIEAELLSLQVIAEYLRACNVDDIEDAPNYLMKLISMASVNMASVCGIPDTIARLEGTASFISSLAELRGTLH